MSFSIVFLVIVLLLLCSNFILYPLLLVIWRFLFYKELKRYKQTEQLEKLSFILVVHNAERLIVDKIHNMLQQDLAANDYEVIIYLDGCTDNTRMAIESISSDKITIIDEPKHLGKISGLNTAAAKAQGDILVFTDADAVFEQGSVNQLLKHFDDPLCGGVCGRRAIKEKQAKLQIAQQLYITIDSAIKNLENHLGNITSNDGKLYAVRRSLFRPIAQAVTDDLYACLNITIQHYRFIYEPEAIVHISTPSRNSRHELTRRKRIVIQSLNGIMLKCALLNPFNYGLFSFGLFINKILRRLIGLMLILLLISSYLAINESIWVELFFYLQLGFYFIALSHPLWFVHQHDEKNKSVSKVAAICWYFCIGNFTTLWGVVDFLLGKRVSKWQPVKQD